MTTDDPADPPLDRRFLLRGGAVLAGAAGATAIGAALAPSRAGAAGGSEPAPRPTLALEPLPADWEGPLAVGEIAATAVGPQVGVDHGDGPVTTFLATGADLTHTYPVPAERLLDSRTAAGRRAVVGAGSATPFDGRGRLRIGQYVDVAVGGTGDVDLVGVFLSLTASRPLGGGYLEACTPGVRPGIPSLTFARDVTITGSTLVAPGVVGDVYAVRVYTNRTTHVIVDLVGATAAFPPPGRATPPTAPRRLVRQAKQRERLVASIRGR